MKKIAIIPAYNEEANITGVIADLRENAADFDYIVINDGSTDNTLYIIRREGYPYINMPFNSGIGLVVQTGYRYAYSRGYDIAVQFDGDGQHIAAYLPALIAPIVAGEADFCIGSRFILKEGFQAASRLRRIGIAIISFIIRLITRQRITDATSGFRAANREAMRFLQGAYARDYPEPESIIALIRAGYRVVEVPVKMRSRAGGKTSIGALRSVYYIVKVVLSVLICALRPARKKKG